MQTESKSVSMESLARKHEAREPHLRNPLIIAASVVFMILFCLSSAGILIAHFSQMRTMQKMQPLGIIAAPDLKPLERFPKPNLEIDDDHTQMTALLAQQNEKLNSYGWIDRSNGIVRIPIDRAMDLIVEQSSRTTTNSQTTETPLQLIQKISEQQ